MVAIGYGAYALAEATGFANAWLTYGVVGALVGLLVGRPIWSLIRDKNATTVVAHAQGRVRVRCRLRPLRDDREGVGAGAA